MPAHQNERGVQQLRAAVACMRAFHEDQLSQGEIKTVTKLGEALFAFCRQTSYAHTVFMRDGIDAFDAMLSGYSACAVSTRTSARVRTSAAQSLAGPALPSAARASQ